MAKRPIFFSFHFDNDVMRVQQIRNIGALESNEPVSMNAWETVKKKGEDAVKKWIDENMSYRRCVVVLVGQETANRRWVQSEIKKAWNDGRVLLGIHIHNLKCPRAGKGAKGPNPFDQFTLKPGVKLSTVVQCYNPSAVDTYGEIAKNMANWVETAIAERQR